MVTDDSVQDYAARNRTPADPRGHDPLVCGLDYDSDCAACRAAADREAEEALSPTDRALRRWDELRGRHWGLLGRAAGLGERPPELTTEQLGALVWALVQPESRELREVLLDLLGPEIAAAVASAVRAATARRQRRAR
jgi:hypothetical protein